MGLRQQLASKSAILFAARLAGAGTVFLAQAAIARIWGAAVLGEYLVAIATINLLAIVLPLGLQTVGSIFAAEYAANGHGSQLRGFAKLSYGVIIFPGTLIALLIAQVLQFTGETGAQLAPLWSPICIMALGSAVFFVNASILVGVKKPFLAFFADILFRPLLIVFAIVATFFLFDASTPVKTALWVLSLSYVLVIAIQFGIVLKHLHSMPDGPALSQDEVKRWFYFALPWVIITLSTDFFFDADLLILTAFLSKEQIAIFGVITRIFILASYGIAAIYAIILPDIMSDATKNDLEGLNQKIGDTNLIATGLSLVLILGVAIFSPLIFAIFGAQFNAGYFALLILCASMTVRAVFGPGPLILSSQNRPYASLPAVGVGLSMLFVANVVLVPIWHINGAAIAALVSYFAASFMVWRTTKRITNVDVSVFPALGRLKARYF